MPSDSTPSNAVSAVEAQPPVQPVRHQNSLWRMKSYLRPYVGRMIFMWVAALGGTAASIAIPLVSKEVIDGPIADKELSGLIPLGALAVALGFTEAFLTFLRRWMQAKA